MCQEPGTQRPASARSDSGPLLITGFSSNTVLFRLKITKQAGCKYAPCIRPVIVVFHWTETGRLKDASPSGEEAGTAWPRVELLCFVHLSKYRISCESDSCPFFGLFLVALFYEGFHAVLLGPPPSSNNGQEERLGGERSPGSNYEAAAELRRLGRREFYFILSLCP